MKRVRQPEALKDYTLPFLWWTPSNCESSKEGWWWQWWVGTWSSIGHAYNHDVKEAWLAHGRAFRGPPSSWSGWPIDPKDHHLFHEDRPLDPQDIASWSAFLSAVQVGGALPVTFRPEGDHVLVEVIVPYVAPPPKPRDDPSKIPLSIAEGFPVPISARYRLPAFSRVNAKHFLRYIVREIYHHEIDEQLRVDGQRPFAPEH